MVASTLIIDFNFKEILKELFSSAISNPKAFQPKYKESHIASMSGVSQVSTPVMTAVTITTTIQAGPRFSLSTFSSTSTLIQASTVRDLPKLGTK